MSEVYVPPTRHRCDFNGEVSGWVDARPLGSIMRCDDCGRCWRRGRELLTDAHRPKWKRVRPWHVGAILRIHKASDKSER